MNRPLTTAAGMAFVMRRGNEDAIAWPTLAEDWQAIHEATTELARVVADTTAPNHVEQLHQAFGELLLTVLTTGLELKLDPDKALDMALAKLVQTAKRKRAEMAQA